MSSQLNLPTKALLMCVGSFLTFQVQGSELLKPGQKGFDGKDGVSYSREVRTNQRREVGRRSDCQTTPGKSATQGGDGSRGSHGSGFDLTVKDVGYVLVTGTREDYGRPTDNRYPGKDVVTGVVQITEKFEIDQSIAINSDGGPGGSPGQGGHGQGAETGQSSEDDAAHENETGGPGCDAGVVGNGMASGVPGHGGPAGPIRVQIPKEDTHLVFAFRTSSVGGEPAKKKSGGLPGKIATGGSGGEGYYDDRSGMYPTGIFEDEEGCESKPAGEYLTGKTEKDPNCTPTEDRYEDRNCKYVTTFTNKVEETEYKCEKVLIKGKPCKEIPQTAWFDAVTCRQVEKEAYRRVIVKTDAGSTGASSPEGIAGADSPDGSQKGRSEAAIFEVEQEDGSHIPYTAEDFPNLVVVDYELVDEDGVEVRDSRGQQGFDLGEKIAVKNLVLRNTGKMDYTFSKADTLISLKSKNWLIANPSEFKVPFIGGGQTITIKDPNLSFELLPSTFSPGSAAPVWERTITPHNTITRIAKNSWGGLELRKPFYVLFPVAIQALDVPSDIEAGQSVNVSWTIQNLSSSAIPEMGEFARTVETELSLSSSNISKDQLLLQMGQDSYNPLGSSVVQMVSGLQPNEIRTIEGVLSVDGSTEPYSTATLGLGLKINPLRQTSLTEIQRLQRQIRVTRVYRSEKDDDLLLVLTESDRQIYRAWVQLFKDLGLNGNIWDLSVDGGFSFFESLKSGGTLSDNFKGKSIVFPKIISQGKVSSHLERAHEQLFKAAGAGENSLYLIGEEPQKVQAQLIKNMGPTRSKTFEGVKDFKKRFTEDTSDRSTVLSKIAIKESYLLVRKPRMDSLLAAKQVIEEWLKEQNLEQPYQVSIDYKTQLLSDGFFVKYELGHVLVRKTLDPAKSNMVLLPTQSNINSGRFIGSPDNVRSLCLSLHIDSRLKALETTAGGYGESSTHFKPLLDCVQFSIFQEWLQDSESSVVTEKSLNALQQIYNQVSGVQKEVVRAASLMSLMAKYGFPKSKMVETAVSKMIQGLDSQDQEQHRAWVAVGEGKIKAAAKASGTEKKEVALSTILKIVNPRTFTLGRDGDEVQK